MRQTCWLVLWLIIGLNSSVIEFCHSPPQSLSIPKAIGRSPTQSSVKIDDIEKNRLAQRIKAADLIVTGHLMVSMTAGSTNTFVKVEQCLFGSIPPGTQLVAVYVSTGLTIDPKTLGLVQQDFVLFLGKPLRREKNKKFGILEYRNVVGENHSDAEGIEVLTKTKLTQVEELIQSVKKIADNNKSQTISELTGQEATEPL